MQTESWSELFKIHVTVCIYMQARTRDLNAEAAADLQYAENVRAALCWVALREKGINGACVFVCMLMWSWA